MTKRLLSLLLVAAAPLMAQPAPPFQEKIDVNVVLLDAVVTDGRGNQILGLGKDDFIVRENGVEQKIDSVDYFTTRKMLDAVEKNAAFPVERVRDERYLIFFFDKPDLSQSVGDPTRLAQRDVRKFLESNMHPEDRVAVVGHDVRLKIYTDFTADKARVFRALDDVSRYGRGLMSRTDGNAEGASILKNIELDRMINRTGTVYEALDVLGNALHPVTARKDLILFSAGIIGPDEDVRGGMVINTSRFFEPAAKSLNRSNVAVYAINLNTGDVNLPEFVHQNLGRLASETNGEYYRFHASFLGPLKNLEKRTVGYYMISYTRPKVRGTSGYQPVQVSLKNRDFRVHARAGYSYGD